MNKRLGGGDDNVICVCNIPRVDIQKHAHALMFSTEPPEQCLGC